MIARVTLLSAAVWTAACSAQPRPPETPLPQIPEALRGCWELRAEPDEEYPNGLSEVLQVKADRIIIDAKGVDRQVGKITQVLRVMPKLIEGRIGSPQGTMATMLELDPEGAAPDTLLLREGDAGSYHFLRCSEATAAAQRYSLVIAETSRQDDPRPAPCGPDGSCGDSLYRAEFHDVRVIAGGDLPATFEARMKLHTPFISEYTIAMIVERQNDGSLLVRRKAGFNVRNGIACFRQPEEWPVGWKPEEVASIRYEHGDLCLFDKAQIDPNAPKE